MATYIRLTDFKSSEEKEKQFFNENNMHISADLNFLRIPGNIYAYWILPEVSYAFEKNLSLREVADVKNGMSTTDNNRFVRWWYECNINKMGFNMENAIEAESSSKKWFPYNKGGEYRKWYGNTGLVVNWENNGKEIKKAAEGASGGRIVSQEFYFKRSVSWSKVSSGRFALRMYPTGHLFDVAGPGIFTDYDMQLYIMALINSALKTVCLQELYPTMNYEMGQVSSFPIMIDNSIKEEVIKLAQECYDISKNEWDAYETSWGFKRHELLEMKEKQFLCDEIDTCVKNSNMRFEAIKCKEESINSLFLHLYGLENKLSVKEVRDEVTLRIRDREELVKSLISYAVGCIMGRYSLKEDGLIYAGGTWETSRYSDDFKPCEYGVMLITEDQYFEEDLCTRVIDFIEVVYGKDTLKENLNFIAQSLKPGAKESARQVLRNYLYDEKGFFDNHYQVYQHRPIYWMMSSGKNGGFRAIVYMHRYNQNTLSIVRSDFLHELRYKYEADQALQHKKEVEAATTADRNDAKKKIAALDKKMVEVNQYDDLINHATGNITAFTFDLDDGVKTNYSKFLNIDGVKTQNLLVPIKL